MKWTQLIVPGAMIVAALVVSGTYIGYSNKVEAMQENGIWEVEFEGAVYLTNGIIYPVITKLDGEYNAYPTIPTYKEYLEDMFSSDSGVVTDLNYTNTLTKAHFTVTATGEGLSEQVLLKESWDIAYQWVGGSMDGDSRIAVFSFSLGPYMADVGRSPYAIVATVALDYGNTITEKCFVVIPDMTLTPGIPDMGVY